jgi:hypothetical protein
MIARTLSILDVPTGHSSQLPPPLHLRPARFDQLEVAGLDRAVGPVLRHDHAAYLPQDHVVEHLRYSIDVFDANNNLVEVLGRLADLDVALAAFDAAVAKHPSKGICLRERARVIRPSDRPRG